MAPITKRGKRKSAVKRVTPAVLDAQLREGIAALRKNQAEFDVALSRHEGHDDFHWWGPFCGPCFTKCLNQFTATRSTTESTSPQNAKGDQ